MTAAGRDTRWRGHAGLALVVLPAVVLRTLIDRRNPPGVTQDSLIYLHLAPRSPFAPFSPTRPSGYSVVLRLLDLLPWSHLDLVTVVQHLAGVAVGVMTYLLAVRLGVRRSLALAAAALALADSHTLALEQGILAETMFTVAVVVSTFLVLGRRPGLRAVGASGLLLGAACTMRTVGLFVVPVWCLWLVLQRVGRRAVLVGVASVALPVIGYCSIHAAGGAGFSLVGSDGWYLYAKVAGVSDCRGAHVPPETRLLCAGPTGRPFEYYLYDTSSPAYVLAGAGAGADLEKVVTPENNRLLRRYSIALIAAHPAQFAGSVLREFFRYLGPTEAQNESRLYATPGTLLAWYEGKIHLTWGMVAGALGAGAALLWFGRRMGDVALVLGVAVALILGAAATSGFNDRYLAPTLPFLALTAALGADELVTWWRARQRPPAPTAASER